MPTVSLQPSGVVGIDAYVYEAEETNRNTILLSVGGGSGSRRIGLLKFDLSSIPAGSTIDSATLTLWNAGTNTSSRAFAAYAILAANSGWTETGATWGYADNTTELRWAGDTGEDGGTDAGCSVSGTDYNATACGTWTYTANDPADTAHSFALDTATVQAWLDGANYGMALLPVGHSATIGWRSSDYGTGLPW